MDATEVWRPVNGYEGLYEVSDAGRIRSTIKRGKWPPHVLARRFDGKGYVRVALCVGGRRTDAAVHRLVAVAFIGSPPTPAHEVNHRDGVKANNGIANLEWATGGENVRHSWDIGLRTPIRGERQGRAKLTWADVDEIRASSAGDIAVADRFGVSPALVYQVRKGLIWREEHRPSDWRSGRIERELRALAVRDVR